MINSQAITGLLGLFFGFVLMIVAIGVIFSAKKAKASEVAGTFANVLVGLALFAMATGAISFTEFGKSVLATVGIG